MVKQVNSPVADRKLAAVSVAALHHEMDYLRNISATPEFHTTFYARPRTDDASLPGTRPSTAGGAAAKAAAANNAAAGQYCFTSSSLVDIDSLACILQSQLDLVRAMARCP